MPLHHSRRLALVVSVLCLVGCARPTDSTSTAQETAPVPTAAPAPAAPDSTTLNAPDAAATLLAHQWQLKSAMDAAGQSITALFPSTDQPLGILAADNRLNVTGGCNRMSAGYVWVEGTQLQVSPGPTTMMACPPALAAADAAIAKFLSGTLQVAIAGETSAPQLGLTAADGSVLTFTGIPTPETRFGGPGTRAFLEVSPKPCEPPAARPCLMVRDRQFDEQGLASGTPGAWRVLPAGIEGYAPVDGEQHVVRVKRFEQAGSAGSAPTEHFVFDMTVETRTVQ